MNKLLIGALAAGALLLPKETSIVQGNPNYDKLFKKYSKLDGLDVITGDGPRLLNAIAWKESTKGQNKKVAHGLRVPTDFANSVSYDGLSLGLMQVRWTTADWLLQKYYGKSLVTDMNSPKFIETVAYLNNPENSVMLASKYFKFLATLFDKKSPNYHRYVVTSYNRGQGNILKEAKSGITDKRSWDYWNPYIQFYNTKKVV